MKHFVRVRGGRMDITIGTGQTVAAHQSGVATTVSIRAYIAAAFVGACAVVLFGLTGELIAQGLPRLDVSRSCEAAARGAIVVGRDKEACLGDERTAQDEASKNWGKFSTGDKNECVGMVRRGGPPSYVELLSCLEIMRDSRTIRQNATEAPLLNKKGQMDTQSLSDLDVGTADNTGTRRTQKRQRRQVPDQ